MRKLEESLAIYIRNQQAGQPIRTYQELCERVAKVKRTKAKLRALNLDPGNQKRKYNKRGALSESVN